MRLELAGKLRDLALFNLGIGTRLSGCDLAPLSAAGLMVGGAVCDRASIIPRKTGRAAQFKVSESTRASILDWVNTPEMRGLPVPFPSRFHGSPYLSTGHYGRLERYWISTIDLNPSDCGTHSLRRTKAERMYRKTGNPCEVQRLVEYTEVDGTLRYLGVGQEDELNIAEVIDIRPTGPAAATVSPPEPATHPTAASCEPPKLA